MIFVTSSTVNGCRGFGCGLLGDLSSDAGFDLHHCRFTENRKKSRSVPSSLLHVSGLTPREILKPSSSSMVHSDILAIACSLAYAASGPSARRYRFRDVGRTSGWRLSRNACTASLTVLG